MDSLSPSGGCASSRASTRVSPRTESESPGEAHRRAPTTLSKTSNFSPMSLSSKSFASIRSAVQCSVVQRSRLLSSLPPQVFLRKLKKSIHKDQPDVAERLQESAPKMHLHHIVKERYRCQLQASSSPAVAVIPLSLTLFETSTTRSALSSCLQCFHPQSISMYVDSLCVAVLTVRRPIRCTSASSLQQSFSTTSFKLVLSGRCLFPSRESTTRPRLPDKRSPGSLPISSAQRCVTPPVSGGC